MDRLLASPLAFLLLMNLRVIKFSIEPVGTRLGRTLMDTRRHKNLRPQSHALFANLAEQEKIKGHHSPEGRGIRTVTRALSGWTARDLSGEDAVVLCRQAMEDWLKARLKISLWSAAPFAKLVERACERGLIDRREANRLRQIAAVCSRLRRRRSRIKAAAVGNVIEFCAAVLERRW